MRAFSTRHVRDSGNQWKRRDCFVVRRRAKEGVIHERWNALRSSSPTMPKKLPWGREREKKYGAVTTSTSACATVPPCGNTGDVAAVPAKRSGCFGHDRDILSALLPVCEWFIRSSRRLDPRDGAHCCFLLLFLPVPTLLGILAGAPASRARPPHLAGKLQI
jgi:hypothetical protein